MTSRFSGRSGDWRTVGMRLTFSEPMVFDPLPLLNASEQGRYRTLVQTLAPWAHLIRPGQTILDYGASWGTSLFALLHYGATRVVGLDIDRGRIDQLNAAALEHNLTDRVQGWHVPDTRTLPFPDDTLSLVLANAVFEHIPQPRAEHLCELWRVVAPGGHLIINETPNTWYPRDLHTTGLWGNQWLPSAVAYRRAVRRGRFDPTRTDWASSGWRGCSYWELARPLTGAVLLPERTRVRHRLLSAIGLPASLLDPYPTWVFRKPNPAS